MTAVTTEVDRKYITTNARTRGHAIKWFRDPFKLVPVTQLPDIADKFTRNEILTSNEVRGIIGYKPASDPGADELRNKNLNQAKDNQSTQEESTEETQSETVDNSTDLITQM
jgi:hypothetical protein